MEKERQRREMERLKRIEKEEEQRATRESGGIDDGSNDNDG
jgi:hypothetical protein